MDFTKVRLVAGLVGVALLAGACGGSTETTEATASPLEEFLGEDIFGFDFDPDDPAAQAEMAAQELEREEKVAACMREQGFEYIPQDNSDFNFATNSDGLDFGSREYAEKYGFGFTTQRFSQEAVGPDLVGYDESAFEDNFEDDPNQAIVEAMDDATRQAYEEALWGDFDDPFEGLDPETMSQEEIDATLEESDFDFTPQGCYGEGFDDDASNKFYQDFEDELDEMFEAVGDDPRIQAAEQKITDCVTEKGFESSGSGEFFEDIFERLEEGMQEVQDEMGPSPFETFSEEDMEAMSDDEMEAMFSGPEELPDAAKARLGELQAEETGFAVAVFDCGGGFGRDSEMDNLYREVSAEYEERFIEANATRLEEYKAG